MPQRQDRLMQPAARAVLTVSQLNREVHQLLEAGFPMVWVDGEISNLAQPGSGHVYFTLKDASAQIRCACFRNRMRLQKMRPSNGLQVLVRGRVGLFEARGDYQLIVESMEPAGDGALRQAFEALRLRLEAEGLFRPERKRPLPASPRRIGVITSPTGAVIRDILHVFQRRCPWLSVLVYPVPVQGAAATRQIADMIALADARREVDALILARGGGSLEDLQCFNEEAVARAISQCQLPLVSAIGHETDVSISDLVADVRAPTPSAAAELLSPDGESLRLRLQVQQRRLRQALRLRIGAPQQRLQFVMRRLSQQHPLRQLQERSQRLDRARMDLIRGQGRRLADQRKRLDVLRQRLSQQDPQQRVNRATLLLRALSARLQRHSPLRRLPPARERLQRARQSLVQAELARLERHRTRLASAGAGLQHLSPLATVARGYSIIQDATLTIVRDCRQVGPGDTVRARLAKGQLQCQVIAAEPD